MTAVNTIDTIVRRHLYYWPSLYYTRTQVLESLFCHGGTWVNGGLGNSEDSDGYFEECEAERPHRENLEEEMADRRREHEEREPDYPFDEERTRPLAEQTVAEVRYVRENIDTLVHKRVQLPAVYPMYADLIYDGDTGTPLAHIPDDARDEWLDAAEELAKVILDTTPEGYLPTKGSMLRYADELGDNPHAKHIRQQYADRWPDADPETRKKLSRAMSRMLSEILGEGDLTDDEIETKTKSDLQKRWANAQRATALNHEIARAALERIAAIRAIR